MTAPHLDGEAPQGPPEDVSQGAGETATGSLYDEGYYAHYEGGSYDRGGHWTRFFGYITDEVVARWAPRSTLDAGCALGVFVEELRSRGVDAWGVDVSEYAIASVPDDLRPYCHQGSLAEGLPDALPAHFDLVSCIEVLEHMERDEADRAIGVLTAITDRILFSSTPDGYSEATHVACRPPEEWSAVFARHGFFREPGTDASFLAPWAVVYSRRTLTAYQAVLEYDREAARLLEENRQLRARVIELDRQLNGSKDPDGTVEKLRLELMAARDEAAGARASAEAAGAHVLDRERVVRERTAASERSRVTRQLLTTPAYRLGHAVLDWRGSIRRLVRRRR